MMMNEDDGWHCASCQTMNGGGVCCITYNTQRCETANGATALSTTDSFNLDYFATACRGISEQRVRTLVLGAADADILLTLQNIAYCRDCRGGRGERQILRWSLNALAKSSHSSHVAVNLGRFIGFGRWDDIAAFINTPLEEVMVEFVAAQFKTDLQSLAQQHKSSSDTPPTVSVSLLAKWFPSEHRGIAKSSGIYGKVAKQLGVDSAGMRKTYLSPLRAAIGLLETKMSRGEWDTIDFSQLPSLALKLHSSPKGAFQKHCPETFASFKENLATGKTKANTGQLFPHQIVQSYYNGTVRETDELLEYAWKQQVERAKQLGTLTGCVVVSDVSGSMSCAKGVPMMVSIAMGILTAEAQPAPWGGAVITFSEKPTWHPVTGTTLCEKVRSLRNASWGMSTNLQAVFDLVLGKAIRAQLPPDEMPKMILIISDMQFDRACQNNDETNLRVIKEKFRQRGYVCPQLVFWNVNGAFQNVPAKKDDEAVSLISGFSVDLLGAVMGEDRKTPEETMRAALSAERYAELCLAE